MSSLEKGDRQTRCEEGSGSQIGWFRYLTQKIDSGLRGEGTSRIDLRRERL
jgi:hypothetical protein